MFAPNFQISPAITRALIGVEADRQAIIERPIDLEMLTSLRETAQLAATHYSTQIEGNRLTQTQVQETLAQRPSAITEADVRHIRGLVIGGRAAPTQYRDGQNVISDSLSGGIVYLPPEAADVPALMAELVAWVNVELEKGDLPAPIVAALAHYQYATIHPPTTMATGAPPGS